MLNEWLIFVGGFLGCFANLIVKYRVKFSELKNWVNYLIAVILSFAIYGLYVYLDNADLISAIGFNMLALFGFAVLLGYALDEIANDIVSLIKRGN